MNFYTTIFRQSGGYWMGLCLENGVVGQRRSKDEALTNLQHPIASFDEASAQDDDVYYALVAIKELHEFLTVAKVQSASGKGVANKPLVRDPKINFHIVLHP